MTSATTTTTSSVLDIPFGLPSGASLKNRLVKAAMSERLATLTHAPTPRDPTYAPRRAGLAALRRDRRNTLRRRRGT